MQVTVKNSDGTPAAGATVNAPTIPAAEQQGVVTNASIGPSSAVADSAGNAFFSFTSNDIMEAVTLQAGSATATVNQHWADIGAASWTVGTIYIGYMTPVTFSPEFTEAGVNVPIPGHEMEFRVTRVTVLVWNPLDNTYPSQDYYYDPLHPNNLDQYATFSPITVTGGPGYATDLTVHDDSVQTVYWEAIDDTVYI